MKRDTARAIERHGLTVGPTDTGLWFAGRPDYAQHGEWVQLRLFIVPFRSGGESASWFSIGTTLDSAVEDYCNARNLQYERE